MPLTEDMLTILPRFCSIMTLPTAWQARKVPRMLNRMTLSNSSGAISSAEKRAFVPATFTRMSIFPNFSMTWSTMASQRGGTGDVGRDGQSLPSQRLDVPTTGCKMRHIAASDDHVGAGLGQPDGEGRPSPPPPPVTIATLPVRSNTGPPFLSRATRALPSILLRFQEQLQLRQQLAVLLLEDLLSASCRCSRTSPCPT